MKKILVISVLAVIAVTDSVIQKQTVIDSLMYQYYLSDGYDHEASNALYDLGVSERELDSTMTIYENNNQ